MAQFFDNINTELFVTGGLNTAYIGEWTENARYTFDKYGTITTISNDIVFEEFPCNSISTFEEELSDIDSGKTYLQRISLEIPGLSSGNQSIIERFTSRYCFIIKDAAGFYYFVGRDTGLKVVSYKTASGRNLESTKVTFTFEAVGRYGYEKMFEFRSNFEIISSKIPPSSKGLVEIRMTSIPPAPSGIFTFITATPPGASGITQFTTVTPLPNGFYRYTTEAPLPGGVPIVRTDIPPSTAGAVDITITLNVPRPNGIVTFQTNTPPGPGGITNYTTVSAPVGGIYTYTNEAPAIGGVNIYSNTLADGGSFAQVAQNAIAYPLRYGTFNSTTTIGTTINSCGDVEQINIGAAFGQNRPTVDQVFPYGRLAKIEEINFTIPFESNSADYVWFAHEDRYPIRARWSTDEFLNNGAIGGTAGLGTPYYVSAGTAGTAGTSGSYFAYTGRYNLFPDPLTYITDDNRKFFVYISNYQTTLDNQTPLRLLRKETVYGAVTINFNNTLNVANATNYKDIYYDFNFTPALQVGAVVQIKMTNTITVSAGSTGARIALVLNGVEVYTLARNSAFNFTETICYVFTFDGVNRLKLRHLSAGPSTVTTTIVSGTFQQDSGTIVLGSPITFTNTTT